MYKKYILGWILAIEVNFFLVYLIPELRQFVQCVKKIIIMKFKCDTSTPSRASKG